MRNARLVRERMGIKMGWIRIEGAPREILTIDAQTGKQVAVVDMQVATAADLPALGDAVGNFIVAGGSNAQIVEADTVTFVTLSGDSGEWYPPQSTSAANNALSMSPTLKKAVDESNGDTINLAEDDIDKISDEMEKANEMGGTDTESEVTEDER